jgi:NAD+ kinase
VKIEAVGILAHAGRQPALECARDLCRVLDRRGKRVLLPPEVAAAMKAPGLAVENGRAGEGQLLIALGGDGTLLAANRMAAPHGTPVLGVHVGGPASFGFLTETTPEHACEALESVLDGRLEVEERLMIRAEVVRAGGVVARAHGLNDLVIRAQQRMLKMRVTVRGNYIATYAADGIIVATPTGSTAYNLAAGGPVVHPSVQTVLLTPICPHTLNVRSLLVGVDHPIQVVMEGGGVRDVTLLTVDGQQSVPLEPGDEITFSRSEQTGRFVSLDGAGFYQKVHTRLRLGERFGS